MKKERQEIEKIKLNQIDLKKINWKTIQGLYFGYKEVINYLVFGVLAMIVNFVSYYIFAKMLNLDEVISSGLSWFCSVLFAYITNKLFVFESKTDTLKAFLIEIIFWKIDIFSLSGALCDVGTFALMVKVFHINDIFSKVVTQVMVVIVNYLFSKLIIFRKKKDTE